MGDLGAWDEDGACGEVHAPQLLFIVLAVVACWIESSSASLFSLTRLLSKPDGTPQW